MSSLSPPVLRLCEGGVESCALLAFLVEIDRLVPGRAVVGQILERSQAGQGLVSSHRRMYGDPCVGGAGERCLTLRSLRILSLLILEL